MEEKFTRVGELRIQKKLILNKNNPKHLEVVIGEIEIVENRFGIQTHYIIGFGGNAPIRIIGKKNWKRFIDMLQWLDWNPEETQEIYIPQYDNRSEAATHENTLPYVHTPLKTLELEHLDPDG